MATVTEPVEIQIMEVVGVALRGVIDQLNVRLAKFEAQMNERLAEMEKTIAAYAPADVTANLIEAIKAVPIPKLSQPKFVLEMPPRESEKTIEYDHRDRPVNIKEKQVTVKED